MSPVRSRGGPAADLRQTSAADPRPAAAGLRHTSAHTSARAIAAGLAMAAALGSAVWLSFGALAVTGLTPASRIGLLPPLWALLPAIALAAVPVLWPFAAGRDGLLRARPAFLLAIFIVLPWLPIAVPAPFLLWLGPMNALLWIGITASAIALARPRWPAAATRVCTDARRAPWIAGALALSVYAFAGWHLADRLPGGDEPHYLIIADSLLRDGDLRIENNHQARQYLAYIDGELKPDYLRRGADGQIYSIHAPGLPALVLPAFALFGYAGASMFLALLSAIGAGLLWRVSWRATGHPGAAWFAWAAAAFSAPFLFHSFTIYPDAAASLFVLLGVIAIVRSGEASPPCPPLPVLTKGEGGSTADASSPIFAEAGRTNALSPARLVLHGAALGFLPWLHTRYALLAAALGLAVILRLWRAPGGVRRIGLFLAAPLVSAIGWFSFFAVIYGTPNPAAPYGDYTQSAWGNVPGGLTGLLLDHQFGLLVTAPALIVSIVGLLWLPLTAKGEGAFSERRLIAELACVIVPYVVATSAYQMWWGGWSAPARFLVPIVLPLGLPAALLWARVRTRTARASALLALIVGLTFSAMLLFVEHGRFVYNDRDGFALWTDWASPVADVAYALPSFFREPRDLFGVHIAIWITLLTLVWGVLSLWEWRLERVVRTGNAALAREWERSGPIFGAVLVPAAYACAVMAALAIGWSFAAVPGLRPDVAQLDFLQHLRTGLRPHIVDYVPAGQERATRPVQWPRLESEADGLRRIKLASAARRVPRNGPPFLAFDVPAGHYRLEPSVTGRLAGRLDVLVGRSPVPIQSYDLAALQSSYTGKPLQLPLTLPVSASALTVRADADARSCIRQAFLYPTSVIPSSDDVFRTQSAVLGGRYGDVSVYTMSGTSYIEPGGVWIKPRETATFVFAREQPRPVWTFLLRNGPRANQVTLRAGSWTRDLPMAAGEEIAVEVPASDSRHAKRLGLDVRAEEGFRPSALDRTSGDHRSLGVWLGVP